MQELISGHDEVRISWREYCKKIREQKEKRLEELNTLLTVAGSLPEKEKLEAYKDVANQLHDLGTDKAKQRLQELISGHNEVRISWREYCKKIREQEARASLKKAQTLGALATDLPNRREASAMLGDAASILEALTLHPATSVQEEAKRGLTQLGSENRRNMAWRPGTELANSKLPGGGKPAMPGFCDEQNFVVF